MPGMLGRLGDTPPPNKLGIVGRPGNGGKLGNSPPPVDMLGRLGMVGRLSDPPPPSPLVSPSIRPSLFE